MSRRNSGSSGRKATAHSRTAFRRTRPLQLAHAPLISKECGRGSHAGPIRSPVRFRQPTKRHGSSFQRTTLTKGQVGKCLRYHLQPGTLFRYRMPGSRLLQRGNTGLLLVLTRVEPDQEWKDGNGNDLAQVVTPAPQGPIRVLPTPSLRPPITWSRSTGNRIS